MSRYTVLIDGNAGNYGVIFPDLPGCTAMGKTIDEALNNAVESLRQWAEIASARGKVIPEPRSPDAIRADAQFAEDFATGATLGNVTLVRKLGRTVKANLSLDSGILAEIDATAGRLGISRSAMVEKLAEERLPAFA
ncbi:MAG: putative RNase H-like HicB family nuclease [Brevundimonas sp.]|jgi:predicted RNase H-like HicB family nuclease|uniref:type II toxin-antitoxin system HicB family antitoxin n=1 Tax=Brevundimonas sp. TaxID=1871086 RepID=UPI0024891F42|nr:type II toxin-antitoxin system HicB family antitoxin [Brevundimonas sp.]MDI1282470.1 type II toxin-antitoxin system HicB family antitoxin [Brevundimonas sp.]